jgi:hypothetical protein
MLQRRAELAERVHPLLDRRGAEQFASQPQTAVVKILGIHLQPPGAESGGI